MSLKNQKLNQRNRRKPQQGSMLIMSIFVLTVMMLLAATMMDILSDSAEAVTYEVFGTRALSAANSGAERTMQQLFAHDAVGTPSCATIGLTSDWSGQRGFYGCTVAVQCIQFDVGATGYTHYRVESTATCADGGFFTVRTIAVEARQR